jgi:hypothetical protein
VQGNEVTSSPGLGRGSFGGPLPVAHAVVDPDAKPRPDALARIWDELGLPAIIPRDAVTRERTCSQALAALGDRVRLHLEAMGA